MDKISLFQIVVMGTLGAAAVFAVLIFGGFLPGYKNDKNTGSEKGEKISLWGTLPEKKISPVLSLINKNSKTFRVEYSQAPEISYEEKLVNDLASGRGPDLFIVSHDMVFKNNDRILAASFSQNFTQRDYLDTFVDGGEIFIDYASGKFSAVPFLIDPIVLFWNKDLFASAGIARAPRDWDEFVETSKLLTVENEFGNIVQSGSALGGFKNIFRAKEILSLLFMQSGDKIIINDEKGSPAVVLGRKNKLSAGSAENSLSFFISFSNPNKTFYSWNKALPNSFEAFSRGSLAMYFGYASDAEKVAAKNPHLSFDISEPPQMKNGQKITFGKIYGLAVLNASKKKNAAFAAAFKMADSQYDKMFSEVLGLASARRDILSEPLIDAYFSRINKMAIISRAWFDPDKEQTNDIFQDMVDLVSGGSVSAREAIDMANKRINQLLKTQ